MRLHHYQTPIRFNGIIVIEMKRNYYYSKAWFSVQMDDRNFYFAVGKTIPTVKFNQAYESNIWIITLSYLPPYFRTLQLRICALKELL